MRFIPLTLSASVSPFHFSWLTNLSQFNMGLLQPVHADTYPLYTARTVKYCFVN